MKFADRLKSLRQEKRYTQEEISRILNLSRSTYCGWETEGKEPDIAMIGKLAVLFGVSCDYLLGYSDERTHSDTILADDRDNFLAHYNALPADIKAVVAKTFDSFYLLLGRDMQLRRPERLALYQTLLTDLYRLRADISNRIDGSDVPDVNTLSEVMALQNELKNRLSAVLDELMQADMKIALNSES